MEYVKTLKSIITVNGLDITDNAFLRDEPITLIVGVVSEKKVEETEAKTEQLRKSDELDGIIESMRLDGKEKKKPSHPDSKRYGDAETL